MGRLGGWRPGQARSVVNGSLLSIDEDPAARRVLQIGAALPENLRPESRAFRGFNALAPMSEAFPRTNRDKARLITIEAQWSQDRLKQCTECSSAAVRLASTHDKRLEQGVTRFTSSKSDNLVKRGEFPVGPLSESLSDAT